MGGEWKQRPLGSCAKFVSGGTPSKGEPRYWGGDIPWVSAKDLKTLGLSDSQDHITELGASNGTRLVSSGTILLLIRGMTLHNDVPICVTRRQMAFNQDIKALRPENGIDGQFLLYALLAQKPHLLAMVDSAGHGTGRLNTDQLKGLIISVPPLSEQKAIADILASLDDKIELNRKMNETLEAMARAIFKSWFVDFDPVVAKSQGRQPEGMDSETAKLFPSSFENSEIGMVPKGWNLKRLGEAIDLLYGKPLKAEDRQPGTIPVFGSNGEVGVHNEKLVCGPGIVVGRKGNPGIVKWVPTDFFPIDTTFYVVPKERTLSLRYLFFALVNQNLSLLGADSAVPGLNRNQVYMSLQLIPQPEILRAFDELVTNIFDRIHASALESATHAIMRDALLPRLLSGELAVPASRVA